MNVDTVKQNDQVLGYTLIRKIGSGGYGDVWEAEAPGGLKKALKIVFGYHDEKRAQAELKSLDRIKEARHPFLLSLERIEIFQSQLVIVTELAEKCLSDLANEYYERGETGIPRDELIGYMRDAADALDYLNNAFGLQHLDIKPENLLLISGHTKVADFGLVKDLREATQSLLCGMTPAYAAPELFDGRPGPFSDQYSLATVYQEMLTMVRPFTGTTPAQLAAQHMHGKPDLRLLPISDQPVVAKALAKEPGDRYKSCAQFVEQLSNRRTRKRVIKSRANVRENVDTASATVDIDVSNADQTAVFSTTGLTFNSVDLEFSDPPECDSTQARIQPTLIIGVGNSSCRVLKKIKQRLVARHGNTDSIPAIKMLCVDTDRDALARLSMGGGADRMSVGETLAMPLRRSDQYRQKKNLDLSWIGRRWIYNVPRSQQTEGLRPLGRMAFVDHFDAVCQKISDNIKDVVRPENVAASCESLGLNPPNAVRPRVILVSNIAGGLGSGITNELAYTIRLMAAENGISDCEIIGFLMYGNEAVGREAGLAAGNAYSFFTEFRHFSDGGYPGDPRLGIPEFEDDLPFDHAYILRLCSEKESSDFSDLDKIAEYVCLSSTTPCSEFFEACRRQEAEHEEFGFRSFGLGICGPGLQVQGQNAVEKLSSELIDKWIGTKSDEEQSASRFAEHCLNDLNLKLDAATTHTASFVSQLDDWKLAEPQLLEAADKLIASQQSLTVNHIGRYFDELFDPPHWRGESIGGSPSELLPAVEREINCEAQLIGDQLSSKILDLVSTDDVCFSKAMQALERCRECLANEIEGVVKGLHSYESTMLSLQQQFTNQSAALSGGELEKFIRSSVEQYGKVRFQEFVLRCCNYQYRVVESSLSSTGEIIKRLQLQLGSLGKTFDVGPEPKKSAKYTTTIQQMLINSIMDDRDSLIRQVEKMVLMEISSDGEQFLDFLSDAGRSQQQLPNMVREAAQSVLSNAFDKISIDDVISKNDIQPAAIKSWLNELMIEATPFVMDCGGSAKLLLGQPSKAAKSSIQELVSDCFDVKLVDINGTTGDLVLCLEAERIPLANVAFSVLKDAPEAGEIAKRIHTRNDIDWTTLNDLM